MINQYSGHCGLCHHTVDEGAGQAIKVNDRFHPHHNGCADAVNAHQQAMTRFDPTETRHLHAALEVLGVTRDLERDIQDRQSVEEDAGLVMFDLDWIRTLPAADLPPGLLGERHVDDSGSRTVLYMARPVEHYNWANVRHRKFGEDEIVSNTHDRGHVVIRATVQVPESLQVAASAWAR